MLNSLLYCKRHRGLALFNGLRHSSDGCRVWNLLGLKTLLDSGHAHYFSETLVVPLKDTAVGYLNLRLHRYCPSGGAGRHAGDLKLWSYHRNPLPYTNADGERRTTPPNVWVLGYPRVRAWIQVIVTDAWGKEAPINDLPKLKRAFDAIYELTGSSPLLPCVTPSEATEWTNGTGWAVG